MAANPDSSSGSRSQSGTASGRRRHQSDRIVNAAAQTASNSGGICASCGNSSANESVNSQQNDVGDSAAAAFRSTGINAPSFCCTSLETLKRKSVSGGESGHRHDEDSATPCSA